MPIVLGNCTGGAGPWLGRFRIGGLGKAEHGLVRECTTHAETRVAERLVRKTMMDNRFGPESGVPWHVGLGWIMPRKAASVHIVATGPGRAVQVWLSSLLLAPSQNALKSCILQYHNVTVHHCVDDGRSTPGLGRSADCHGWQRPG